MVTEEAANAGVAVARTVSITSVVITVKKADRTAKAKTPIQVHRVKANLKAKALKGKRLLQRPSQTATKAVVVVVVAAVIGAAATGTKATVKVATLALTAIDHHG